MKRTTIIFLFLIQALAAAAASAFNCPSNQEVTAAAEKGADDLSSQGIEFNIIYAMNTEQYQENGETIFRDTTKKYQEGALNFFEAEQFRILGKIECRYAQNNETVVTAVYKFEGASILQRNKPRCYLEGKRDRGYLDSDVI